MSLAERTREAARARPFLVEGLRAKVVNYTAAARFLDVDGEVDAVATALRRYGEGLDSGEHRTCDVRVTMHSGVGWEQEDSSDGEPLLTVGGVSVLQDAGADTAILATGEVETRALAHILDRLHVEAIDPKAAGVADDALVIVVDRREGVDALRIVEDGLESVPST